MRQMMVNHWEAATAMPDAPAWLRQARQGALRRFGTLGWPRGGAYKHTDLRAIEHGLPLLAADDAGDLRLEALRPFLPKTETGRIVFVDGHHAPQLSDTRRLPRGVLLRRMGDCLDEPQVQDHLEAMAKDEDALVCLGAATWQEGAFVHVPSGTVAEGVIHIVFIQTGQEPALRSFNSLVVLEAGSQATVLESHLHTGDEEGWTLSSMRLQAAQGAHLRHAKVQKEDSRARHFAIQRTDQGRDSTLQSVLLDVGGRQARQSIESRLGQPGAECDLQGVFFGQREQSNDLWTRIDHVAPDCRSHEIFKGILDDASRGAFTGLIKVHPGAHGTSSEQENRNLLLSDKARVDATPQLEIDNDDVQCSHGSTIGQLDEGQLFFLRSRGIGVDQARMMLTRAFASGVIESVPDAGIRQLMDKYLHVWFIKHQEHLK